MQIFSNKGFWDKATIRNVNDWFFKPIINKNTLKNVGWINFNSTKGIWVT
jgi:hypothetical protein